MIDRFELEKYYRYLWPSRAEVKNIFDGNPRKCIATDKDPRYAQFEGMKRGWWWNLESFEEISYDEVLQTGEIVEVWSGEDSDKKRRRIFLKYTENAEYPYICVAGKDEGKFYRGETFKTISSWQYVKRTFEFDYMPFLFAEVDKFVEKFIYDKYSKRKCYVVDVKKEFKKVSDNKFKQEIMFELRPDFYGEKNFYITLEQLLKKYCHKNGLLYRLKYCQRGKDE